MTSGRELDEAAKKRAEAAAAGLAAYGDSSGIGAKLLAQMGFGSAGSGLGRAGQARRPTLYDVKDRFDPNSHPIPYPNPCGPVQLRP